MSVGGGGCEVNGDSMRDDGMRPPSSSPSQSPKTATINTCPIDTTATTTSNDIPMEIYNWVSECSLFQSAPKSFLSAVTTKLRPLVVSSQEYITTEGEEAIAMYWLVKGSVNITSRDGESVFAELSPGSYFGEIGILFDRPRTASVVANTKCLVLSLNREYLRSLLPDYPTIDREIRVKAQQRLAELMKMKDRVRKEKRRLNQKDTNLVDETVQGYEEEEEDGALQAIETVPLLSLLPTTERQNLAKLVEQKQYKPQEYVFRQGERDKCVYFIVDGLVDVIDENSGNVRASLSHGSMFGEFSFLGLSPCRTASVKAVSTTRALKVAAPAMASLCRKYVDLQNQLEETAETRQTRNHIHNSTSSAFSSEVHEPESLSSSSSSSSAATPLSSITKPKKKNVQTDESEFVNVEASGFSHSFDARSGRPIIAGPRGLKRQASQQLSTGSNSSSGSSSTSSTTNNGIVVHARNKRQQHVKVARRRTSLFNVGPFPDIIQIHIFQYMDLKTLMQMRRVCTHWQDLLTKSNSLIRELDLSKNNTKITDKAIKSIVNFAGARPKYVNVSNCFHLTDDGFSHLVNGLGLAGIKKFEMKSVWNVSDSAILDLTVPSIGMDLEEINLSNCRKANDSTVSRLIGWVVPPHHQGFPPPGTVIGCPKLKKLNLSYCKNVTDRCMYHIATYAADRVEELNLTRCTGITDQGFAYWSQSMRPFTSLKVLNLADCTFLSDKAIISLAGVAKELEELNLSFCCALTDVALQVLSMGCTKLKRLNLAYCGSAVSDRSLNMIALHLHQLEYLSVRGCVRVTKAGIDSLRMGCSKLVHVDSTQCRNYLLNSYL